MLNFDYLLTHDNENLHSFLHRLHERCSKAEVNQATNPEISVIYGRQALEYIVAAIYQVEGLDYDSKDDLFTHVTAQQFVERVGDRTIINCMHLIRKVGNLGAHGRKVTLRESREALMALYDIVRAYMYHWDFFTDIPHFDLSLIPLRQAPLTIIETPKTVTRTKTEQPSPAITASAETAETSVHISQKSSQMTEADTRKMLIDIMLKEAGWDVMEEDGLIASGKACIEIEVSGMPNASGTGRADYVLFGNDGVPLAVIEAKSTSKDVEVGRKQACLYADCLERKYGYRPAIYYTNGLVIKYIDGLGYPDRSLYGYHSIEDLQYLRQKRGRALITDMRPNPDIAGRDYQKTAVKSVCEHFNTLHRRALLVMATGTGKTRTAISLTEILTRNNWAKNILFLADRTALVRQAYDSFVEHLPAETKCILSEDADPDMGARIMFSTYQTMVNYIDGERKHFSVGRFDLIIIDEAHRSVFGKYGAIFDYFDSLLVGLTATPREDIDRSTYDLLYLEGGQPNFSYELDDAVRDGNLVSYKVLKRTSDIINRGVKYDERTKEEKEQLETIFKERQKQAATDPDENLPDSRYNIREGEIYSVFYNRDTISKMLDDLMTNGLRIGGNETVGKTIIFAYNHETATLIVDVFREKYPEYGPDFCQLIDNYVNYAQDILDKFRLQDRLPQIAVSVDMLDTGVDVPSILNLVFFKMVHSKIKFWQMIGRGTRLCKNIFGPERDKEFFYIFDYCGNFEYFGKNPEGVTPPTVVSLTERLFGIRLDIAASLQDAEHQQDPYSKTLHDELKDVLCSQVCSLEDCRIGVRRVLEHVYEFRQRDRWTFINEFDVNVLKKEVAPLLPRTMFEEMAMRFDVMMLNIMLGKINPTEDNSRRANKYIDKVIIIAEMLEQKASIPQVNAHMDTIGMIKKPTFWDGAGLKSLEDVRRELRDLMQYLADDAQAQTFIVDFVDKITEEETNDVPVLAKMSYKEKILDYLENNMDSETLSKIRNMEQLTAEDISELERIFWQELGSMEDYENYIGNKTFGNIAAFIRSVIGINRSVAMENYRSLIADSALNSQQELYLKNIIDYVCQNGDIEGTCFQKAPLANLQWSRVFGTNMHKISIYVNNLHNVIFPSQMVG